MLIVISGVVGAALGLIATKILFVGSALSLIPWALVGLATGIYAKTKREALVNGAVYGFILSFIFLLSGYNGSAPVVSKFPGFTILSLFGALCGLILGFMGHYLRRFKK